MLLRSFRSVKLGGLGLLVECVAQLLRLQASSAVAWAAPPVTPPPRACTASRPPSARPPPKLVAWQDPQTCRAKESIFGVNMPFSSFALPTAASTRGTRAAFERSPGRGASPRRHQSCGRETAPVEVPLRLQVDAARVIADRTVAVAIQQSQKALHVNVSSAASSYGPPYGFAHRHAQHAPERGGVPSLPERFREEPSPLPPHDPALATLRQVAPDVAAALQERMRSESGSMAPAPPPARPSPPPSPPLEEEFISADELDALQVEAATQPAQPQTRLPLGMGRPPIGTGGVASVQPPSSRRPFSTPRLLQSARLRFRARGAAHGGGGGGGGRTAQPGKAVKRAIDPAPPELGSRDLVAAAAHDRANAVGVVDEAFEADRAMYLETLRGACGPPP